MHRGDVPDSSPTGREKDVSRREQLPEPRRRNRNSSSTVHAYTVIPEASRFRKNSAIHNASPRDSATRFHESREEKKTGPRYYVTRFQKRLLRPAFLTLFPGPWCLPPLL